MKILWVKAGKLWPVDTGGKIRSFNVLRHLARNHDVTLLSYYGGRHDTEYETVIANCPGPKQSTPPRRKVRSRNRSTTFSGCLLRLRMR